jgi:hypothetical protein
MLRRCYPSAGEKHSSMSAAGSQGDGITMAAEHGAIITGHDTGLLIPLRVDRQGHDRDGWMGDVGEPPRSPLHRRNVELSVLSLGYGRGRYWLRHIR